MNKLKIAIIGCGQIADAHAQEIRKIQSATISASCDHFRDLAVQLADRFDIPHAYDNIDEMLVSQRPDIVHITTPPHTHSPIALKCLAFGAHVYIEKPFSLDVAEADVILSEASRNQKKVCVGHDQLFDPIWLRFRKMNYEGRFGKITHIDSVMGYNLEGPFGRVMLSDGLHWVHRLPGKIFQNNISHAIYKITDLVPDESPEIRAFWYGDGTHSPSELRVMMRGDNCTANVIFSGAISPFQRIVRVYGTKAVAEIDFDGRVIRVSKQIRTPGPFGKIEVPLIQLAEAARSLVANSWSFLKSDIHFFAGMNLLFREFYKAVATGLPSPTPPSDIRRVTSIMDQIFVSCKS